MESPHRGKVYFQMDEGEGKPSRWNTLRAMRVLNWYEQGPSARNDDVTREATRARGST